MYNIEIEITSPEHLANEVNSATHVYLFINQISNYMKCTKAETLRSLVGAFLLPAQIEKKKVFVYRSDVTKSIFIHLF